jgi:hypothetical protein
MPSSRLSLVLASSSSSCSSVGACNCKRSETAAVEKRIQLFRDSGLVGMDRGAESRCRSTKSMYYLSR